MILLHRLNNSAVYINPDLVKFVESAPDTVLTFTDGRTLLVKESVDVVCQLFEKFRKKLIHRPSVDTAV